MPRLPETSPHQRVEIELPVELLMDPGRIGGLGGTASRAEVIAESIRRFLDAGGTTTISADLEAGDPGAAGRTSGSGDRRVGGAQFSLRYRARPEPVCGPTG